MTYIVTGAAGFIGSNIVKALNNNGISNFLAVDNLKKAEKFVNLADNKIIDYMDKDLFIDLVREGAIPQPEAVIHQGACSDTMETDGRYMMNNNFRYTQELFIWCQEHKIPFLYASSAAVYGASTVFKEDVKFEKPLTVYGFSKNLFDQYFRKEMSKGLTAPVTGLRYFNVYGPMEQHKGRMASVAYHQFNEYVKDHKVKLFEGCLGFPNGGQRRDFVYVEDVADVNMFFLAKGISGIYNCGTGMAQEFNDVSLTVVNTLRERFPETKEYPRPAGQPPLQQELSLQQAVNYDFIEYIPFPQALVGKYQPFTQADLTALREAGYEKQFRPVEQGVMEYMLYLLDKTGVAPFL
ncbi:MAG: ADP-glyceromanno-heptose 6-epimerase [Burkholderiales bacterium]|nr:ADP-glyceromanno-heptose 6-epimerase [Burkholderiales bacterium]